MERYGHLIDEGVGAALDVTAESSWSPSPVAMSWQYRRPKATRPLKRCWRKWPIS